MEVVSLGLRTTQPKDGIYTARLCKLIVKKATIKTLFPPKPKHINVLVKVTFEVGRNLRDVFVPLASRLQDSNWVSIFKSLILFYRLFRDGATKRIYEEVCLGMGFNFAHLYQFRDTKRTLGPFQSLYIQHFARYLDAKVSRYGKFGQIDYTCMDDGESIKKLRQLSLNGQFLEYGSLFLDMLDACLSTPILASQITTEITLTAYRCLVKDTLRYYHGLNELVIHMLDAFFSVQEVQLVADMLSLYQRMVRVTEKVIDFLQNAKKIQHYLAFHVPVLVPAPKALEAHLKEYLSLLKSQDSVDALPARAATHDCDLLVQNQSQLLIDFECEQDLQLCGDSALVLSELDLFRHTMQDQVKPTEQAQPTFHVQIVSLEAPQDILADFSKPTFIQRVDTKERFVLYPLVEDNHETQVAEALHGESSSASPYSSGAPFYQPSSLISQASFIEHEPQIVLTTSDLMSTTPLDAPRSTTPLDDLWLAFNKK